MKRSPEDLEKLIHQTLRSLPERRAPRTLESRVMAAIEARAALPWWKQSFSRWPIAARCVFLLLSGGFVKLALMAAVWVMAGFDSAQLATAFTTQFGWIGRLGDVVLNLGQLAGLVFRSIPPLWLYGAVAIIGALYASLFGLGAAAYRFFYAQR